MFHFGPYRPDFRTSQIKKISSDFSKLIKGVSDTDKVLVRSTGKSVNAVVIACDVVLNAGVYIMRDADGAIIDFLVYIHLQSSVSCVKSVFSQLFRSSIADPVLVIADHWMGSRASSSSDAPDPPLICFRRLSSILNVVISSVISLHLHRTRIEEHHQFLRNDFSQCLQFVFL